MEIWKTIPGTNNKLEVSNYGNVRSLLRGKPYVLKTQRDKKGYHRIRITINRVKMSFKVHRLVAKAFIENPNNLPQVNHIDGNKDNNQVSNLEWISNKDNANHAVKAGLWTNVFAASKQTNDKRKIAIKATDGHTTLHFESISSAEKYFKSRHVVDVLKGKRKTVKGFSFAYESEVM